MTTTETPTPHPCTWSAEVLRQLRQVFQNEAARQDGRPLLALDPFAGQGLDEVAAVMPDGWFAVGIELEPEWACQSENTMVGDATQPPECLTGLVDVLVTSPTYGNRFADGYRGQGDTCKADGCGQEGAPSGWRLATDDDEIEATEEVPLRLGSTETIVIARCATCSGSGKSPSQRYNYAAQLGREPSEGSSCRMKWRAGPAGAPYRRLHGAAWSAAWDLLAPGALIVINVSNSMETVGTDPNKRVVEHHVTEWHLTAWLRLGALLVATIPVSTQRMRNGANRDSRTEHEWILVLRKPRPVPVPPKSTDPRPEES